MITEVSLALFPAENTAEAVAESHGLQAEVLLFARSGSSDNPSFLMTTLPQDELQLKRLPETPINSGETACLAASRLLAGMNMFIPPDFFSPVLGVEHDRYEDSRGRTVGGRLTIAMSVDLPDGARPYCNNTLWQSLETVEAALDGMACVEPASETRVRFTQDALRQLTDANL